MWKKIVASDAARKKAIRYILLPLLILSALGLGGAALWKYVLDPWQALQSGEDWRVHFDGNRVNLLLLGFDRKASRDRYYKIYRPDTIMIASINLREPDVALVNIPRDSYVKINGTGGYDKINHAYMYGYFRKGVEDPDKSGVETVIKTIEDFLGGIPVHYYVRLDMDAVVEIIDRLGGFYYDVDIDVRAKTGRGRVLLKKGYQHLTGKDFMRYVRNRAVGGDLGRAKRQQKIVIAAFRQLRRQGRLSELPGIYRTLNENVETNLSARQIAALALLGARIDPGGIKTHVFPGEMQYAPRGSIDALNYWIIDEEARVKLIREVFGVRVARLPQQKLPGPRRPAGSSGKDKNKRPRDPFSTEPVPSDQRQRIH